MRKILWALGGTALFLGLLWAGIFLVYMPSQLAVVARQPITETPRAVGLDFEEAVVEPEDAPLKLRGWWMPAGNSQTGPKAGLLAIHGAGGTREMRATKGLGIYKDMNARGFSILAIDLRNHGQSDGDGTGRFELGLKERHDVRAGLAALKARLPGKPLYAFGLSMGGASLIHALTDEEMGGALTEDLQGLILLDPLLDYESATRAGTYAVTGIPGAMAGPAIWTAERFYDFPGKADRPLERASQMNLPILILQDAGDPVTQRRFAEEFTRLNKQTKLWLAPDVPADHPAMGPAGRWGTHGRAYLLHPEATMHQVDLFLAATGHGDRQTAEQAAGQAANQAAEAPATAAP
jgi:alpha-beta hydrolase superfamily lysophospholipase